jgi:general L-amino acid transport system substrate-binding protein
MKHWVIWTIAAALAAAITPWDRAEAGAVLDKIRSSKTLTCGIDTDEPDYSKADTHGNMAAFGADLCRAVASAILGPGATVKAVQLLDEPSGLAAVKSGAVDMLAGATPSLLNTGVYGVAFGPVMFYDGQSFLVSNTSGIRALKDLAGKTICFIADSDADQRMQAGMKQRGIVYRPFPFEEIGEMQAAFLDGHCDALTGDISFLAFTRPLFGGQGSRYAILAETITQDPLAPAYRRDDPEFGAIVDWTMQALIKADEAGVTQAGIDSVKAGSDIQIQGLAGLNRGLGEMLGLDDRWAFRAIKAVGNYGEIFERDLGARSSLKLPRGQNKPWSQGGLMDAMPIR